MLVLIIRTLILYFLVVCSMRLMGKRQIGEMQPSELAVAIMISDLASVPMQAIDLPLLSGIVPVLTLLVGEITMSFVAMKSRRARQYISGTPSILIENGRINIEEMERLRFNLNDLMEQLRLSGTPNISEVQTAVLETNGKLSVIEKKEKIKELPYMLIVDGEINYEELSRASKGEKWLKNQLKDSVENVFVAILEDDGKLYVQKKEKKK